MAHRVIRRRWRGIVLVIALIAASHGVLGPETRYHSQSLANEWWDCLVSQTPPTMHHELIEASRNHNAARRSRQGIPSEAGLDLPSVSPQESVHAALDSVAWPETGLAEITIAVIDSGVSGTHHGFMPEQVMEGLDAVNPCGDGRTDPSGHGTAVAGVIASGQFGVAPQVKILPVRTSLATGIAPRFLTAGAIMWATNRGADVINLSRSSRAHTPSRLERAAVRYATNRGVVLVASAGNNPFEPATYPAAYPEVISVTAVNGYDQLSVFAARRGHIDVAAPGSRVTTLDVDGDFRAASGTSLAAPFVAASIARLKAANPMLTPDQLRRLLTTTARPLQGETTKQIKEPFGIVDLDAAVRAALSSAES